MSHAFLRDEEVGWGALARCSGLARRRFGRGRGPIALGDADWGALAVASINLTAGIVNAVAKGQQANSQGQQPAAYSCPQGYYFDERVGQCVMPQGNALSNIDPTTLAIGVGVLVLLVAGGKS